MKCLRPSLNLCLRTLLLITYLYFSGCLEFESIKQPSSIMPGELFSVLVEVVGEGQDPDSYGSRWYPISGICLPAGWIIPGDTVEFTGTYQGSITYDPNLSLEQDDLSPAPEGYYWWVGRGPWLEAYDPDEAFAEIPIQASFQPGMYSLEYLLYFGPSHYGLKRAKRSDRYIVEVADEWTPRGWNASSRGSSVVLTWLPPLEKEGLAGYYVYRDGELLNSEPFTDSQYSDQDLPEGVFHYSVSSLYENGDEHIIPNEIKAIIFSEGTGEPNAPYQVTLAEQLVAFADFPELSDKHFVLNNNIDLDPNLQAGRVFNKAVVPRFAGTFDGQGYEIQHLSINQGERIVGPLGLFGQLESGGQVRDLGITDVNVTGTDVAGLVSINYGELKSCYVTGVITGDDSAGGLAGGNEGKIIASFSTATVGATNSVGGLVGGNSGSIVSCYSSGFVNGEGSAGGLAGKNYGSIVSSYSTGSVSGHWDVGGLVGLNGEGSIVSCYSTGSVSGQRFVGGLVGLHGVGSIVSSYSTGSVSGQRPVGGLVGSVDVGVPGDSNYEGRVFASFWDIQTSLQTASAAGTGLTTSKMQRADTYLSAGWDFIDETPNGADDIWWIDEGRDYPRLWWELIPEN